MILNIRTTLKNIMLTAMLIIASTVAQAQTLTPKAETQLQNIDKMLRENPSLIPSLENSLIQWQEKAAKIKGLLKDNQSYFESKDVPFKGSDTPALTIINFTDFSCPYCKLVEPELNKLLKAWPQIKVVDIYLPIKEFASAPAKNSSTYALNVWKSNPKAFKTVSEKLFAHSGVHDLASITKIAQDTNTTQYLKNSGDSSYLAKKNLGLFDQFGFNGTPTLIVGDQVIVGMRPFEQLNALVASKLKRK